MDNIAWVLAVCTLILYIIGIYKAVKIFRKMIQDEKTFTNQNKTNG